MAPAEMSCDCYRKTGFSWRASSRSTRVQRGSHRSKLHEDHLHWHLWMNGIFLT